MSLQYVWYLVVASKTVLAFKDSYVHHNIHCIAFFRATARRVLSSWHDNDSSLKEHICFLSQTIYIPTNILVELV